MKCILFVRCSTEKQEIESQLAETKKYAESLHYDEFIPIGRVGASAAKVDKLYLEIVQEMKDRIVADPEVKAVVCWHLNRLARNDIMAMDIKKFLVEHKVQLHIFDPNLKLLNDDGSVNNGAELVFSIFATMSQQQAEELRLKSSRAKTRDKALHKYLGGRGIFGYHPVNKFMEPHPVNAKIVNDIYDLYGTGQYSFTTLAAEINERYGTSLVKYRISQILENKHYYDGEIYPPIITKAQFEKAEKQRKDSQAPKPPMTSKYHYFGSRIVQCPKCGYAMIADTDGYRCINRCKGNRQVGVGNMDGLLWLIASHLEGQRLVNASARDEYLQKQAVLRAKIEGVAQSLTKGDKRAERGKKMALDGLIEIEEYKAILEEVEQQTKDIKAKQAAWEAEIVELQHLIEEDKLSIQRILTIADRIYDSDELEMRNIVRRWVRKVTVDDDFNVEVHTLTRVYKAHYRRHSPAPWYTMSGQRLVVPSVVRKDGNCCFGDNAKRFNKPSEIAPTLAWLNGSEVV